MAKKLTALYLPAKCAPLWIALSRLPICLYPITRRPPSLPPQSDGWRERCFTRPNRKFRRENLLKRNPDFARLTALLAAAVLLAALLGRKSQVICDAMAAVDGRKIFRSDVDKYYDNSVASAQQAPAGEQATILRLNLLRQLIVDAVVM